MHFLESLLRAVRLAAGHVLLRMTPLLLALLLGSATHVHAQPGIESAQSATDPAQPTSAAENVIDIRILGNDTIATTLIDDHISTRIGRPFDRSIVQRDVRQLFNLGWFVDVKPLYETTPQGRIVIFQVVERPTIRYISYLGNDAISDKKLGKETNLKTGGAIDPYAVEEGRTRLVEYYQGKGYNNVQITIMEGTKPTDKGIVYLINEGNSEKVWDVDFVGNEFVSSGRLKTLIKSKPPKFLFFKGYMNRDDIDADVDRLTAYYRSFGFFQARISRKIDYYDDKKWVKLTYVIHEGMRYKIRNVQFLGNTKFEPTAMAEVAELKTGDYFEQTKVLQDRKWIRELYGSHGYVFADIQPEPVFLEEPGEVDLIYRIEEGEQFRIGNIIVNIGGDNPHTRQQVVLNQISIHPGEIADTREFDASRRRVQASGIFHVDQATGVKPEITYRITDESNYESANRPMRRPSGKKKNRGSHGFGSRGVRGQSSDDWGPLVLPPPPQPLQPMRDQETATDTVIRGQSPEQTPVRTRSWVRPRRLQQPQTVRKPANTYQNIRGQSPAFPTQNAYSTLPAGGVPQQQSQQQYGGQLVGATGPASQSMVLPPGGVQQTQYSENIPPPAGSFGPTPGFSANPVPGYELFPDGRFGLPGQPYPQQTVDVIFNGQETQTGRLMFGVGVNSNAGLVGNIVLDERNFDWRRWPRNGFEDFRNGTAFRGDMQRFRIDASPGSQVNRYLMSFQEPYFLDTPVSLGLSGSYFDRRYQDWDEERLGGRISLGHQWVERDFSANVAFRGERVNIINAPQAALVPELGEALGSNSLFGFKLTGVNDTRDSTFLPTQGRYLELSGEYVTGTYNYPRVMVDYRRFFLLRERPDRSGRHVLSFSTNVGWQGDDSPIYEHFFAGGFTTLRGFDFRGASPVDAATGVEVGGEFQWLNSLQYLFPITADEMLHGVVFCDFGTVERDVRIEDFRVVPGVGLRINVPALGPAPIALDFGWAVSEAPTDDRQVFSFSMGFGRN